MKCTESTFIFRKHTLSLFRHSFFSNHNVHKNLYIAYVFGLQTLKLIDFSKSYQLKGLQPKNKVHTNYYERCDSIKKVDLTLVYERKYTGFIK